MKKILFYSISLFTFHFSLLAQTSSEIYWQLKKLNVLGSVLYVAAHPDDENNSLLPYLAKEKLYRTGYLSLTRGDGGQNLIGSEQGIELGLIRTQELIAARKIDGAEQYFTRAYEFGFSKSFTESLRIWDKEKVLADMVWVIRNFQPDVIIKRFPPDARAGHGHHAASAVLADEAFTAAADPKRFPEQLKYGVTVWQAKRLMWNTFNFGSTNTTSENQLKIDIGNYNALLGKSYGEIGGEARTMHKSQGEGRPKRKGSILEYFTTTAGDTAKNSLMDNIDISWKRMAGGNVIEQKLNNLISSYSFEKPELSVAALIEVYKLIKVLPANVWTNKKLNDIQELIEACSGLFTEATTNQEFVVQGDTLKTSFFFNKRKVGTAILKKIQVDAFDTTVAITLSANQNISFNKAIFIPASKPISQPYWLAYPQSEGMFDVRDQTLIGKAESDPSFVVSYTINIEGEDFLFKKPVQYKTIDPVRGEVYQPVPVLPKVEVSYDKENYLLINGKSASVSVIEKSNSKVEVIDHFNVVHEIISNNSVGENKTLQRAGVNTQTIKYDHIPTQTYFKPAKANLVQIKVKTKGKKIGYIVGAGDKVPACLEALGYAITFLSEKDITTQNLKQFDAIVTGIRAHNIYPWLSDKNETLNTYIQNGGNLIVQYLKSNTVGLSKVKVGPYPFIVNGSTRVTEENATINFLLPNHAALNYPNKIDSTDFNNWVQERSTYQAEQLDSHYETLISMNDTNEKPSNGSLVIGKYGKGNFVYLSLVMFRQLPAGVSGAYRLMANLIALPKNKL